MEYVCRNRAGKRRIAFESETAGKSGNSWERRHLAGSQMRMLAISESTRELRLLAWLLASKVVMRESEPARRRRSQADHTQFRMQICMLGTKRYATLAVSAASDSAKPLDK
jgi:hypothetical protein